MRWGSREASARKKPSASGRWRSCMERLPPPPCTANCVDIFLRAASGCRAAASACRNHGGRKFVAEIGAGLGSSRRLVAVEAGEGGADVRILDGDAEAATAGRLGRAARRRRRRGKSRKDRRESEKARQMHGELPCAVTGMVNRLVAARFPQVQTPGREQMDTVGRAAISVRWKPKRRLVVASAGGAP